MIDQKDKHAMLDVREKEEGIRDPLFPDLRDRASLWLRKQAKHKTTNTLMAVIGLVGCIGALVIVARKRHA